MRVFLTGAAGQLGRELLVVLAARGHEVVASDTAAGLTAALAADDAGDVSGRAASSLLGAGVSLDLRDRDAVMAAIVTAAPDLVVHPAAFTAVDLCESEPELADAVNVGGTQAVVAGARAAGARVLYVSTDYVFDGTKVGPYVESDPPNPRSVYGRTKLAGERTLDDGDTVARTSWLCGRHGPNMVKTILRLAASQPTLRFVDDQVGHPTIASDLARVLVDLAEAGDAGIFHTTNQGPVSWYGFAREVLAATGDDPDRVEPCSTADLQPPRPAPRPANSVLDNEALRAAGIAVAPDFRESLPALLADLRA